jgi:hypothetical protein
VLIDLGTKGDAAMNELVLPVPQTVSATYTVPVSSFVNTAEARQLTSEAIKARLAGPLRLLTSEWLARGAVKIKVEQLGPPPPGLMEKLRHTPPERRALITQTRTLVHFSATQRASLIGVQEWMACGPAAALAASLGTPVFDWRPPRVLTAEDALAGLPDIALTMPATRSDDVTVGFTFTAWVRVLDVSEQGVIGVLTNGMRRFGLPELRMGPASPGLREELTALLNGVAFKMWTDLLARAQEDTPKATGLMNLPRLLHVPAEMEIHRRDLDRACGVPNRGGTFATIGLQFDPAQGNGSEGWLTVCPPAGWDSSWDDFVADTCHGLFGFEKPRWHYMPEFGAFIDALLRARTTLPEARSRFLRGDLPPGAQLMVRYDAAGIDELLWAQAESWEDPERVVVRDIGRELAPGARTGLLITIETSRIADWGIWVDGTGVIEGADTEGVGQHLS